MSEQPHEDPVAHASTKITSYVSVAAVAAEAVAQVAAARARERATRDERAAAGLRAQRRAAYGQARLAWAPMLDRRQRDSSSVLDAGRVWAAAQPWRPDPEAEQASRLAEDRLRQLRPDVMERYDRLRADGTQPVEAMRRVAPFFDRPAARTGEAGPDRAALAERDTARRAGDAEMTLYRGKSATLDDPATLVDEHADAAAQAAPHRTRADREHATAALAPGTVGERTPTALAADGYPLALTAGSTAAAAKATAGRPAVSPVHRTAGSAAGRGIR